MAFSRITPVSGPWSRTEEQKRWALEEGKAAPRRGRSWSSDGPDEPAEEAKGGLLIAPDRSALEPVPRTRSVGGHLFMKGSDVHCAPCFSFEYRIVSTFQKSRNSPSFRESAAFSGTWAQGIPGKWIAGSVPVSLLSYGGGRQEEGGADPELCARRPGPAIADFLARAAWRPRPPEKAGSAAVPDQSPEGSAARAWISTRARGSSRPLTSTRAIAG